MAYTTINKSTEHFNTKLYTGTGNEQAVTGMGFQPDLTWIKRRSASSSHKLFDSVRTVNGEATLALSSDNNSAENDVASSDFTSIDSDGFTVKGANPTGANSSTYVGWGWKANGAGSSNYDGSITSTVSANTTAGFSIVSYTGNGTNGATVGHGLGVAPKVIMIKRLTTGDWLNYHSAIGGDKYLILNKSDAQATASGIFSSSTNTFGFPTSYGGTNPSSTAMIAYCFAEKTGYSKFGSYTGNGNANGTFVYTGFKPAFVIIKCSSSAGTHWRLTDSTRYPDNLTNTTELYPSSNTAETTNEPTFDFLSNGFKLRGDTVYKNGSGQTYIYMAFGQSLVGQNNVPCTAR